MKIVVARKGHQHAETRSQGEERLRRGIDPDRCIVELTQIGPYVVLDAFHRTVEKEAANHQNRQDDVRKERRKPNDLARRLDSFPHGEIADQVDECQAGEILPVDRAETVQADITLGIEPVHLQTRWTRAYATTRKRAFLLEVFLSWRDDLLVRQPFRAILVERIALHECWRRAHRLVQLLHAIADELPTGFHGRASRRAPAVICKRERSKAVVAGRSRTAIAPGQNVSKRGEEIVQCPRDDHVVVEVGVEGNDRHGPTDAGEQRTDLLPARDCTLPVVLAEKQFKVEQRHTPEYNGQSVWNEKCT